LFPGTKLKLQPASTGSGALGSEFEASLMRYLAAALGVSHEELSRDYSNMNYTTMRGSISQTHRRMQARKTIFADRCASSIYRLWLEEEINNGRITSMPRKAPSFYEGLNSDAYTSCAWIGASRGQIDELKETQAAVLRIANNLSTLEEESARLGKDYRKVLPQREREMAEEVKRGLPTAGATLISGSTQFDNGEGDEGSDTKDKGGSGDKKADPKEPAKKDSKK
jgi:lambda family phage portal protein